LFALLSRRRQRTSHQRRRKRPTSNIERPALNDPGRGVSQPLQGALKKCVLERRLKCARVRFTDAKLGSDFKWVAEWTSTSILPHFASDARTVLSANSGVLQSR